MLFYIKRYLWLEIGVSIALAGAGLFLIRRLHFSLVLTPSPFAVVSGAAGWAWLATWTFAVQLGYRLTRGPRVADELTASLAKEFSNPSVIQIVFAGITACGEEIFFRGFLQQALGLVAASLLFMLAHFGKKDIRVVSFWSIFQGLYLGVFFLYSGNLVVPMVAHGLFDVGGMIYFRRFMAQREKPA